MAQVSRVTMITDPLLDPYGVNRVAILLGSYLSRRYDLTVVSARISGEVRSLFPRDGITFVDLGEGLLSRSSSFAYGESWLREALLGTNGRKWGRRSPEASFVINLSNTISAPADVWHLQGTVGYAISCVLRVLPSPMRHGGGLADPVLGLLDEHQIATFSARSTRHIANSRYCSALYRAHGVPVDGIIHPPLDTTVFHPTTATPSGDYCVAYMGKETDPVLLRALAEAGVRLRVFGSRMGTPSILSHRNISLEGRLSDASLADLYSHARFTIFPFTTEPFGYIPVESLSCGTPVLTFNKEGPAETVAQDRTGWLCPDIATMRKLALEKWREGAVPSDMRKECIKTSAPLRVDQIGGQWVSLIKGTSVPH